MIKHSLRCKIMLQNLRIDAFFPTDYYTVHHSTKNGTYHYVTALRKGHGNIKGHLRAVVSQVGLFANTHLSTL